MASPFHVFRKHQKVLIATLGVLAMVAFVFLPIVMDRMGMRATANPVVVKTKKYGNIRQYELNIMQDRRRQVLHFLQRVAQAVAESGGRAMNARQFEFALGPDTEQSVVDTWLCAEYAKRLGLVVSDRAINKFIRELTENRLTPYELKAIFKHVRVSQFQFFELLRHELLAMRFRLMFNVSLSATTPVQRWDYFTRLKRRAAVEAVPIAVEQFVSRIKDPDEKTLREFFGEHKETFANPASPEPGFHRPHKVAVRYFKADYEKFVDAEAVTDDEIEEFYQEHKEDIDRMSAEKPDEDADDKLDEDADDKPDDKPNEDADDKPADKPAENDDVLPDRAKKLIREMLARRKAAEKISEDFNHIQEAVSRYGSKYARYQADKEMNQPATEPEEPDYGALAQQYGLSTAQTPMISQLQARDYDIGRSLVGGREPFGYVAYRDNWPPYLTETSADRANGDHYLFWKVEETAAAIPKFDDKGVQEQVLRTWKMVQARRPARNQAQWLAAEATQAAAPLQEVFADRPELQVIEPPPFSRLTRGSVPAMSSPYARPRLSTVEGIDYAGNDFMQAVFKLEPGKVGVAMNNPQTIAYVVRISDVTPTENALWAQFEVDSYGTYRDAATADQSEIFRAWYEELISDAGLKWVRKADQRIAE